MKTRIRSLRLEKLEDRQLLDGAGLGLDVGPPEHHPVGPPEVTPPDDVPVLVAPPVDVPEPEGGPDTIDHDSHGGFTGGTVIPQGETLTVIGPHHADEAGHDSGHFFAETGDDHHFAWVDRVPSTSGVIEIWYDFRNAGGRWGKNEITAGQIAMAELALDKWEEATNGKIIFTQNTGASSADIINIGTGNLRALGYRSGPGGILGLGGGNYTHNSDHTITGGVAWMDSAETWDVTPDNEDVSGTIDYFTVVAQEIGHALGLGHVAGDHIMDGSYTGPVDVYSDVDDSHIQAVYGDGGVASNQKPIADAGPDQDVPAGTPSVILDGSASDDPDSLVSLTYSWTVDGGATLSDASAENPTITVPSDGTYIATLIVNDGELDSSPDSVTIVVGTPMVATKVGVDSISYATEGGKGGNKNLLITLSVADNLTDSVSDATVAITLTNSSTGGSWNGSATTGADGTVTFKLRNAPDGIYTTKIENVIADGLDWDGITPTENSVTKPIVGSSSNAGSLLLSGASSLALGIDAAPLFGADDHPTGPTDTPADPPAAENRREDPRARARVAIRAGRVEWTAVARRVAGRSEAVDDLFEGLGEDPTDPGLTLSLGIDL